MSVEKDTVELYEDKEKCNGSRKADEARRKQETWFFCRIKEIMLQAG